MCRRQAAPGSAVSERHAEGLETAGEGKEGVGTERKGRFSWAAARWLLWGVVAMQLGPE